MSFESANRYAGDLGDLRTKYASLHKSHARLVKALELTFEDCPVESNCVECDTTREALRLARELEG